MKQHSRNAMYLARRLSETRLKVIYPGLESHPQHDLMKKQMNEEYGFGGMLAIDLGDHVTANRIMQMMQDKDIGYLAVSLGYFKTLFSCSGHSTSSEVPEEIQKEMGLSEGLTRLSVGLDNDIERTCDKILFCLKESKIIS